MHIFAVLASTMALIGLAAAQDVPAVTAVPPPTFFKLQTQVIDGNQDCGTNKSGLWVTSFHTGAGLGDATLTPNVTRARLAYLNGTQQLFTYAGSAGPWPLVVSPIPYSRMASSPHLQDSAS